MCVNNTNKRERCSTCLQCFKFWIAIKHYTHFNIISIAGEGQFGKVYTAVNVESGELMAMKEVCKYIICLYIYIYFVLIFCFF